VTGRDHPDSQNNQMADAEMAHAPGLTAERALRASTPRALWGRARQALAVAVHATDALISGPGIEDEIEFLKIIRHCIEICFGWPGSPTIGQHEARSDSEFGLLQEYDVERQHAVDNIRGYREGYLIGGHDDQAAHMAAAAGIPVIVQPGSRIGQYTGRRTAVEGPARKGAGRPQGQWPTTPWVTRTPFEDAMLETWWNTGPGMIAPKIYDSANAEQNDGLQGTLLKPFGGPGQTGMETGAWWHVLAKLRPYHLEMGIDPATGMESYNVPMVQVDDGIGLSETIQEREYNAEGKQMYYEREFTPPWRSAAPEHRGTMVGKREDPMYLAASGGKSGMAKAEENAQRAMLNPGLVGSFPTDPTRGWSGGERIPGSEDTATDELLGGDTGFVPWPTGNEQLIVQIATLLDVARYEGPWANSYEAAGRIAELAYPLFRLVMSYHIPKEVTDQQETAMILWAANLFGEMMMECVTEGMINYMLKKEGLQMNQPHAVREPTAPGGARATATSIGGPPEMKYSGLRPQRKTLTKPFSDAEIREQWMQYEEDMMAWTAMMSAPTIGTINGTPMTARQNQVAETALRWYANMEKNWTETGKRKRQKFEG